MQFANAGRRRRPAAEVAVVDPPLDGDVRFGFVLELSLFRILAVLARERLFDIDRMGRVALDEIGVVAVHRAHEIRQRRDHARRQAAPEAGRRAGQFDREIAQARTVARPVREHERLHRLRRLMPVFDRQ